MSLISVHKWGSFTCQQWDDMGVSGTLSKSQNTSWLRRKKSTTSGLELWSSRSTATQTLCSATDQTAILAL